MFLPLHSVGWKLSPKKARQSHCSPYSCRECCRQDWKGPSIYLCAAWAPSAYNCLCLQPLQCSSKAEFLPTAALPFNWQEILIALQSIHSNLAFNNSNCNTIFDGKQSLWIYNTMQVAEVHRFQCFRKWVLFSNRANPITKKKNLHSIIHNLLLLPASMGFGWFPSPSF